MGSESADSCDYESDYDYDYDYDSESYDEELSGVYFIRDCSTGKYLTVNCGGDYNFNPVGIYPYCGAASQMFDVSYCSDCGYYHLCPESSAEGRRLDITGGQLDIYLCYGCYDYCCFNIYDDGCGEYVIENSEGYLYAGGYCDNSWDYVYTDCWNYDCWEFIPADQPEQDIEADPDESVFFNITFYIDGEVFDTLTVEEYYTLCESDLPDLGDMWYEGWYFEGSEDPFDSRDITEDVALYARFPERIPVTLYYTLGGVYESDTIYVPYGECLNEEDLPVFVDEGYVADGWYLEDDYYEEAFDFSCPLTHSTSLFLKAEPEEPAELYVVLFFVNDSVYSMEFAEEGTELDLPQEVDFQDVIWYTNRSCTHRYRGGAIHENMSLYTHVTHEQDFYIIDAETNKAIAFDTNDFRYLSGVYVSSVLDEDYDADKYKVKWHITFLGGTQYSVHLAEDDYSYLHLSSENGLDMVNDDTAVVHIIENGADDNAQDGQFDPDYMYGINGRNYYIVNVDEGDSFQRSDEKNRLKQLIEALSKSGEASCDRIWNDFRYSEKEKNFLLSFGDVRPYNTDAQNVRATYDALNNLAAEIGADLPDVIEAQLWVARNDYNWYYITSLAEDTDPDTELEESLVYKVIEKAIEKAIEDAIEDTAEDIPAAKVFCELHDMYKVLDEAETAYASYLDRREAATAAGETLLNYTIETLLGPACDYIISSILQ